MVSWMHLTKKGIAPDETKATFHFQKSTKWRDCIPQEDLIEAIDSGYLKLSITDLWMSKNELGENESRRMHFEFLLQRERPFITMANMDSELLR